MAVHPKDGGVTRLGNAPKDRGNSVVKGKGHRARGIAPSISASIPSRPGDLPFGSRRRHLKKTRSVSLPSNLEGDKGGVGGTSAAQGKSAEGSTVSEGDKVAEAREWMQ